MSKHSTRGTSVHSGARRGRPIRLGDSERILSKDMCDDIVKRTVDFAGEGETRLTIHSWWNGELRWARNRVSLASDRRDVRVRVERNILGAWGDVTTNQIDDASLESSIRAAERKSREVSTHQRPPFVPPVPQLGRPQTSIWSKATYDLSAEARGEIARALADTAEAKGMLSAGYLEVRAGSQMVVDSRRPEANAPWDVPYVAWTQAQCSMTVRDPQGTGSGWAGLSSYDWAKIDSAALAERALEKCMASRHPVALEPGRYTVILEPQAVADLLEVVVRTMQREFPERNLPSPWLLGRDEALGLFRTKLGLKVVDERITIGHDPADPELGILPDAGMGPVTWIDRGVLTSLAYDRAYALEKLNANTAVRGLAGYRMNGGDASVEDMIRTTKRGLLVTRLFGVEVLDPVSLLSTGVTRDGLWLIENGKISKAVRNLRFTESPLFVLNSIDELGPPAPVFRPVKNPYNRTGLTSAIVPPVKARDFSFTSTIDAI